VTCGWKCERPAKGVAVIRLGERAMREDRARPLSDEERTVRVPVCGHCARDVRTWAGIK
jgi:hypothetical protein